LRNFQGAEELFSQAERADLISVEAERHQFLCTQGKADLYNEWGFDLTQHRELPEAAEKFRLAIQYIGRALEQQPTDHELKPLEKRIQPNIGRMYRMQRSYVNAFKSFQDAILNPAYRRREQEHNARVQYEIAVTYRAVGKRDEASQAARRGLNLSNNPKRKERIQELLKSL
jgi:tetratricopeptide (TPR) repeat protein